MGNEKVKQGQKSEAESSPEGADKSSPVRCRSEERMEDDALNDKCFGNDFNNNGQLELNQLEKGFGAGLSWAETKTKNPVNGNGSPVLDSIIGVGYNGPEFSVPDGVKMVTVSSGDSVLVTPRAYDDVRDMGLFPNLMASDVNLVQGKSSWVDDVDRRMNARNTIGVPDQCDMETARNHSEDESPRDFFPELSPKNILKMTGFWLKVASTGV
ncbi:hypothetical protein V6N11_076696 [Hibiscus sabdariffa]|uniref:Uncharacterized protein n=1 Tax=Hibiscus sabdariffa TaxID=183260 RepID=A0ABR2N7J3_9ROSI